MLSIHALRRPGRTAGFASVLHAPFRDDTPPGFMTRALALAVGCALAVPAGLIVPRPGIAQAAELSDQTSGREYAIPAGPLADALAEFAAVSGVQLVFDPHVLDGLRSGGLQGRYGVQEGFDRLLAGSGYELADTGGGRYSLRQAVSGGDAAMLAPVEVESAMINPGTTEGTGSYTTGSMSTATKLDLSPRETPQSVSVLTSQQMKDQNLITLDDAVQSIPGLVMRKGEFVGDSGEFAARGFGIDNLMLDGLPTSLGQNGTFNPDNEDLAIYDRVEVVRGATGLTTGSGNPSAAINLARKRPTDEPALSVTGAAGSWSDHRLLVDGSNALNDSKTLRGRAVASIHDKDNFYDHVHDNTRQLYGILEYDLTPATRFTAGAHWRDMNNDGVYTRQPANEDGSFLDIPRSASFNNDFDYWDQRANTVFAELRHQFDHDWSATLSAVKRWQDVDMMFSGFSRIGGTLYQNTQNYILDRQDASLDLHASGPFSMFDREHELAVGLSHRRDVFDAYGGWADYSFTTAGPVIDIHNWDPHAVPKPAIDTGLWTQAFTAKQTGAYAAARFNVADPLKFIIGGRVDSYDQSNDATGVAYNTDTQLTPYAGLIYDLNTHHSLYTSWTEIFQPQTVFDKNGDVLDPITGTNLEAGIKGEYLGGKLNASLAIFRTFQENRPVDDLASPNPCPGTTFGFCQRTSGEVKVGGVELEISGELSPDWQLTTGYVYTKNEFVKDQDPANIGEPLDPEYPEHQFKLATGYQLSNKWRVGSNLYYQSGTTAFWDDRISQGGYTVAGLNAGYTFNKHWDTQLNINNVLDKHYYQNLGWLTGGNQPGEPRSFVLTFNWRM